MKKNDLMGQRFGRLVVIKDAGRTNAGKAKWLCLCDCGNTKIVSAAHLRDGTTTSCGCYQRESTSKRAKTHGLRNTRIYHIWTGIKDRCCNPNCKKYPDYGGRGITMCKEWQENVKLFTEWAFANGYEEDLTLDRIDNDGNYCPENCRWVTMDIQNNNKRNIHHLTYQGRSQTVTQWATEYGIDRRKLYARIFRWGWTIEKAFRTP